MTKNKETVRKYNGTPVYDWELEMVKDWSLNEIRNQIWGEISCGQPVKCCVSVAALRYELERRGEIPVGYHNT
ncbi:MAG: hypothetical protein K2K16_09825 [Ruminococcus sp.]|nr:hypothetical protein [Ruminococcus sp.]